MDGVLSGLRLMTPITTQMSATISVAMCTHNGAMFVEEQLQSIALQTRVPDELVICDDGSTDSTVEIVTRFASIAKFPVRLEVNQSKIGVVKNFESAITRCSGAIVALCDQDDYWRADKLETLEAAFSDPEVGMVFSNADIVDEGLLPSGRKLWDFTFPPELQREFDRGSTLDILIFGRTVTGATMAFRSAFLPLVLPLPMIDYMIHDAWIALMISLVSRIVYIDEALVMYRQHHDQLLGVGAGEPSKNPSTKWFLPFDETVERERAKLRTMAERLQSFGSSNVSRKAIREVQGLLRHLEFRNDLPGGRLQRVPGAVRELCASRYHRYSNGWQSFLKDTLLR
jgi:glycosyltransferase involved in cell wall biosynthesis